MGDGGRSLSGFRRLLSRASAQRGKCADSQVRILLVAARRPGNDDPAAHGTLDWELQAGSTYNLQPQQFRATLEKALACISEWGERAMDMDMDSTLSMSTLQQTGRGHLHSGTPPPTGACAMWP